MSRIFITGDVHCPIDIDKLRSSAFKEGKTLCKDDYVIIVGDGGFVWDGSREDKYWINWISKKPWTTIYLDGNHENFNLLNQYPVTTLLNGRMHRISDSLYHVLRGEILTINDLSFFCFGGAFSDDLRYRKENVSWWQQELPVKEEIDNAYHHLEAYNYKVDYVLTHDIPDSYRDIIGIYYGDFTRYDSKYYNINDFLEDIDHKVSYKQWFNGHYHLDKSINNHRFIYNDIVEIKE